MKAGWIAAAALVVLGLGCTPPPNNHCNNDDACVFSTFTGRCFSTWCAVPDDACPSSWRYHDTAESGLANICVPRGEVSGSAGQGGAGAPGMRLDAGRGLDAPPVSDARGAAGGGGLAPDAGGRRDAARPDAPAPDAPLRRDAGPADARRPDAPGPDGPLLALGAACQRHDQCAGRQCRDGVCCDSPCDGVCVRCDLASTRGTCTGIPNGDPDEECQGTGVCGGTCAGAGSCTYPGATTACGSPACNSGTVARSVCSGDGRCSLSMEACFPYACSASGAACEAACTASGGCGQGAFCDGTMCRSNLTNGSDCTTASACASGSCVDGVCCADACTGACRACNLPGSRGLCTVEPEGTECGASACPATTTTRTRQRCAAGSCQSQQESCNPYMCAADGVACKTACGIDADCANGHFCRSGGCIPKLLNGATCNAGRECQNTFCISGVCCDSACNHSCKTCVLSGAVGTCSNRPTGSICEQWSCVSSGGDLASCNEGACNQFCIGPGLQANLHPNGCCVGLRNVGGICNCP